MPKYSEGPFMGMSPSGVPGFLVVLVGLLGVCSLFVPEAYRYLLFPSFFIAVVIVVTFGLIAQFRSGNHARPESLAHLFPTGDASSEPLGGPETRSERQRQVITAVLAIVAAVSLTLFGLLTTMLDAAPRDVWSVAALGLLAAAGLVAPSLISWWRRHFRLR